MREKLIIIGAYFVIISIIGWVLPYADKKRAKEGKWRIRESTLFLVSAFGGSAVMYASMKKYHHKTKHKRFMIGIPCIIVIQIAALAVFLYFYHKSI